MLEVSAVKKLVDAFKEADGWRRSEGDIQAQFVVPLLRALGWRGKNLIITTATDVGTGKVPDILAKDDAGFTELIMDVQKPGTEFGDRRHEENIYKYARAEGKYWGVLTNFIRWRIYSVYLKRGWREYAFHDLGGPRHVTDLLSAEGLTFLESLTPAKLCARGGRFSDEPGCYPPQEEIKREFFEKLRGWRGALWPYLEEKRPMWVSDDGLYLGAQKILDRLIFMDFAADKQVIPGAPVRAALEARRGYWREATKAFARMDELFNSELFARDWVDDIEIEDAVIEPIMRGVAEVDFETLSPAVIGEVYEDYLGELLREAGRGVWARAAGEAAAKAKRRARGVYYTPEYIVDYIVRHTVGEILTAARTEDDIKKVKVLDPACGSGSFLIRAFDEFATAYARVLGRGGHLGLFGFDVKRQILEDNLFGIDLDARAVEICKLNLMIKALEGTRYEDLRGRKLLPNLSLNIRVGNSLVGGEVLNERAGRLVTAMEFYTNAVERLDERRRRFYGAREDAEKERLLGDILAAEAGITAELDEALEPYRDALEGEVPYFNYAVTFPDVFGDGPGSGGFDAVIGNPPYVRQEALGEYKRYLGDAYEAFVPTADLYVAFVERALRLTKSGGRFGFIVSNKWMRARYGLELRKFVKQFNVEQLIDFGELKVFADAATFPLIVIAAKAAGRGRRPKPLYAAIKEIPRAPCPGGDGAGWLEVAVKARGFKLDAGALADAGFTLVSADAQRILDKMRAAGKPLGKYVGGKIYRGVLTGFNKAFVIDEATREELVKKDPKSAEIIKPFVVGDDVRRYYIDFRERFLIFTRRGIDIDKYPAIKEHLAQWKAELTPKKTGKEKKGRKPGAYKWFEIQDTVDYYAEFEKPKILYGQFQIAPHFSYDDRGLYFLSNHYMLYVDSVKHLKYLLAILSSNLYFYYMKRVSGVLGDADKRGRLISQKSHILKFPVYPFDSKNAIAHRDNIVKYVDRLLGLSATPLSRHAHAAEIAALSEKIDELVYDLYGLTPGEVKIVEGS